MTLIVARVCLTRSERILYDRIFELTESGRRKWTGVLRAPSIIGPLTLPKLLRTLEKKGVIAYWKTTLHHRPARTIAVLKLPEEVFTKLRGRDRIAALRDDIVEAKLAGAVPSKFERELGGDAAAIKETFDGVDPFDELWKRAFPNGASYGPRAR